VDAELPISVCPVSSACLLRGVIATLVSIIKIPVTGGDRVGVSEIDDGIGIGVGLSGCGGHSASRFVVPRS
jgi:hypothetical protein